MQENIMKSLANHHRIELLNLLSSHADMSVEEIAESTGVGYKTIAVHLHRLAQSGLITKKYYGRRVEHRISPRGVQAVEYLRCLS